jgi:hypothetical protein
MALSDLLLLAAIVLVLAILGAGGYVLMFRKQFSFLKRPYPETGVRLSKRLGIPTEAPADISPLTSQTARELTPEDHAPSTARTLVVPGINPASEKWDALTSHITDHTSQMTAMEIAGEFPVGGYEPSAAPPLPWSYDECKITALVRDPYWLFAYWEIDEAKREEIARRYGDQAWNESWPVLRVYDATNLYFFDSRHYTEISINDYANNWYIRTGQPNKTFCIELGRVRPDRSYIFLARSNFVSTPRDQISEVIDEEWLLLPEYATRLYRRIGGIYPGPSSPGLMGPVEYISSPGFVGPGGGISSPMKW